MSTSSSISDALVPVRAMLSADGYDLEIISENPGTIVARIKAGPNACAECLVPKDMMRIYFDKALQSSLGSDAPAVEFVYPADGNGT